MPNVVNLTPIQTHNLIRHLATRISNNFGHNNRVPRVYGIPRGGIPIALALAAQGMILVDTPAAADCVVDDIIDSGTTRDRYLAQYDKRTYAMIDKTHPADANFADAWIVFPWEGSQEASIEDAFIRLLQYIGEDPKRGGLLETPARMARAWHDWTSGYSKSAADVLKVFSDGAEAYDEAIAIPGIPFYSHCEHHLAPFFGEVIVSYIPNGKIVGLSKLARVVDIFAKRLQVQERLTTQICDSIHEALQPRGVGVCIKARHLCMESRGVAKQGQHTVTTALRGVLMSDEKARAEFLRLT